MFCKNCGKELPDGVKFCNGCGAPVTPAPDSGFVPGAGQFPKTEPFSADDSFVPGAGQFPKTEPFSGDSGFIPGAGQPQQPGGFSAPGGATKANPMAGVAAKLKGNKTGLIIVGVGAIAIIAVIVLVVNLVGGMLGGGGGSKNPMYAYLTDDYELMYLPSLSPDAEAVELTDKASYSSSVQFAPDGKTLYFTDADRTLYKITLAGLKKEEKPERIKRDVSTFRVLDDGRVLYREYDSGKLSVYDGSETFTLVKEYDSYQLSEDHKTVYFTEREDDNTLTLSRIAIDKDAKAEELLDGADVIFSPWDADTLVYGEGGVYTYYGNADGGDPNTLAIYACKPGEKAQKLIDDIYSITGLSQDGDKVSFYYWVQDKDERTLYDFVTDEKAGADAALVNERPTSPSSYDYSPASYPNGLYIENGVIYCVDHKGDSYPVDTSSLEAQQNLPPEELGYWDVLPLAQSECTARYEAAREEYEAAYEAWRAASNRESIRATLRDSDYTQISYELYHYDGAKPQDPIATDVNSTSSYGAPAAGIFLYKKANTTGGKVGDVADLESAYDIYELMESGGKDNDWYQNVGGKESVLEDIEPEAGITTVALLNKTELILRVSEDDETSLQSFTVGGEGLKLNDTIVDDDDDFSGVRMGVDSSGKDVLYLFTEVSENSRTGRSLGDFCVYRDGKLETIVKEIYGAAILDDSGVTYLVTDYDREGNYELALLKDGKPVTISDEMSGTPYFLDSTQILYITDGDLYLWDGKEEVRIARDVLHVWLNTAESYTTYDPGY